MFGKAVEFSALMPTNPTPLVINAKNINVKWEKPNNGVFKLNTDGAVKNSKGAWGDRWGNTRPQWELEIGFLYLSRAHEHC